MAYTEQQKRDHIRELQGYLHSLSHVQNLPHVSADGIYGVHTAEAVREFQKQNQLRPTGETNSATWNAIVNAYQTDVGIPAFSVTIFPTSIRSHSLGSNGTEVYLIQALLQAIHETFAEIPAVTVNGLFDDQTKHAVEQFQNYTKLPSSGTVDSETWNRLLAASGAEHS